jgi:hypothetical protein
MKRRAIPMIREISSNGGCESPPRIADDSPVQPKERGRGTRKTQLSGRPSKAAPGLHLRLDDVIANRVTDELTK